MESDEDMVAQAQSRSAEVANMVQDFARRPFVVEFTGTPKSGKSTTMKMVADFLKQAGWRLGVIEEKAAECPLSMKGHFFFNTWTTTTMLADLLDAVDGDSDVLLLDRGLFDATVWLGLQKKREQVADEEAEAFDAFVLLERWRKLQNVTFVLTVDPKEAMRRENLHRLIPREGSLMTSARLAEINEVLDARVQTATARQDFELVPIDTTTTQQREVALKIINEISRRAESWADRPIAVVPRDAVETIFGGGSHVDLRSGDAWATLQSKVISMRRSQAEMSDEHVQLVACGIYQSQSDFFVFDRETRPEKAREYGRRALWKGTHVELEEGQGCSLGLVQEAALTRLRDDLHLQTASLPIEATGLVWTPGDERKQNQHLGVIFVLRIDNSELREHLRDKEFKSRGRLERSRLHLESHDSLVTKADELELEPWSREVLKAKWLEQVSQ